MTTLLQIAIDWDAIHAAAKAVDDARGRLGYDGVADAWGGTYWGGYFESRGLAGLHPLATGANQIRHAAWKAIHQASTRATAALVLREQDGRKAYWSTGCDGRADMCHRTHRGAAWRASRFGGAVVYRDAPGADHARKAAAQKRHAAVIEETRRAVATAIALHDLYCALATTGIVEYRPGQEICGVTDTIQITGLRWLVGEGREDRPVSANAASAFVSGGIDALRAALTEVAS